MRDEARRDSDGDIFVDPTPDRAPAFFRFISRLPASV
jgi:predicted nucleotidyltransferase